MEMSIPTREQLSCGLRGLKMLALADGDLAPEEQAVLNAVRETFGRDAPPEEDAPTTPEELAAALSTAALRAQFFGAMVVMAMSDGEVNEHEARVIAQYARALEIDDGAVANLERIARGQLLSARLDIARRQWAPRKLREMAERDGAGVYYKAVLALLRLGDDPDVAARFCALGELAPGTLGRAYFDYTVDNDFKFPGERGGPPELAIFHDLTHVLSGYGTTPEEEILVATFSAGYSTHEVANWLVFVLAQFHLGIQMAPNVPPTRRKLNVRRMLVAYRRGAAMNIDLNVGWDPWPLMGETVAELRRRYNILPAAHFFNAALEAAQ